MSTIEEVHKTSEQFYAALNSMLNGDAGPMSAIWSHSADVTTMHPIGGREVGWEAVSKPWEQVAGIASDGQVKLEEQHIQVGGDMACEAGFERGQCKLGGHSARLDHRVTNIYRREAGGWKIVHHHTDLSPEMLDILHRLQSEG